MAKSSPTRKSLPALIGGAVLVLVAGYFGIDLGDSSGSSEQKTTPSSAVPTGEGGSKGDRAKQSDTELPTCAMDTLPQEAHDTTEDILAGVVSLPHGWGHDSPGTQMRVARDHAGVNANILTDELGIDTLSGNAVLNGVPVRVEAVEAVG